MAGDNSWLSGISDTFSDLAKTYLVVEGVKAQAGAVRAQTEYDSLTGYNSSFLQNPNALPLTAQQQMALLAQQGGALGISTPVLLVAGVALVALVLVLK